jgi:type II secretory pathway pseudopilin PulG
MNKFLHNNKGYTLIETMIAVSLFIVVVTIGMDALLNANLLHQKSSNLRSIIDNLSFIMEDMSRNMRTGYNFRCYSSQGEINNVSVPQSCASGWAIAFEGAEGEADDDTDQWVYYISDDGKIFKSRKGGSDYVELTTDEIKIDPASIYGFSVLGAEGNDEQQPLITIKLVGTITYKNIVSPFSIETAVSQRVIDI